MISNKHAPKPFLWETIRNLKKEFPGIKFVFRKYCGEDLYVIDVFIPPEKFKEVYNTTSKLVATYKRNLVVNYYFTNGGFNFYQENLDG